jgi:hypothetical protein
MKLEALIARMGLVNDLKDSISRSSFIGSMLLIKKADLDTMLEHSEKLCGDSVNDGLLHVGCHHGH